MTCKHKHGDTIPHVGWVCGKCYKVLEERPTRYGMRPTQPGVDAEWRAPRQAITWQAEIKTVDGVTLSTYAKWVAQRFMRKGGLDEAEAYRHAVEAMRMLEEEFGNPGIDWGRTGANDIADEEMSYWDCDAAPGSNGSA